MPRRTAKVGDLELRFSNRTRKWTVPIPVAGTNRRRWVSTGCRSLAAAAEVVSESGVNRLVHLANADAVTAAAVQIITAGRKVTALEILGSFSMESDGRWSAGTLASYRSILSAFFDHAGCRSKALIDVTREQILAFVNHGGAKAATRNTRMVAIRSLYRYARARNFVLENPAETAFVETRKMSHAELEPKVVQPLTEQEFRLIVGDDKTSDFWRAITSIGYWTGLRFADCVGLEWASLTDQGLIVWTRKKGRRVCLSLDDPLLGAGELRSVLGSIPRTDETRMFPEEWEQLQSGRRSKFPTAFARILERLGITGKSFHSTRHAAITRLRAAGMTLESIGKLVAHADAATTERYVHTP